MKETTKSDPRAIVDRLDGLDRSGSDQITYETGIRSTVRVDGQIANPYVPTTSKWATWQKLLFVAAFLAFWCLLLLSLPDGALLSSVVYWI
jgi:hypothetical protein